MNNIPQYNTSATKFIQLLSMLMVLFGFVLMSSVTFTSVLALFGISANNQQALLVGIQNHPIAFFAVTTSQILAALLSLVILPILYLLLFKREIFNGLVRHITFRNQHWLYLFFLILSIVPLVGVLARLNKWLIDWLPLSAASIDWINQSEKSAALLTKLIVFPSSWLEYPITVFTIAILPAIGEELLFRGYIQNNLIKEFNNHHVAIWTAAFLFSFIHFQFYGFIPRMLLGALFGYLFHFSGNLLVPIFLHFLNNSITLVAVNILEYSGNTDPLSAETAMPLLPSILFFVLFVLVFMKLYTKIKVNKE